MWSRPSVWGHVSDLGRRACAAALGLPLLALLAGHAAIAQTDTRTAIEAKRELAERVDDVTRMFQADPRYSHGKTPEQVKDGVEFVTGNVLFVLAHEVGHALIREMELPVLGKEEDAADAVARMHGAKLFCVFVPLPAPYFYGEYIPADIIQGHIDAERARAEQLRARLADRTNREGIAWEWRELGGPLETLHNQGFVHAAVRPENFVIGADGGVKLLDVELVALRDKPVVQPHLVEAAPAAYLTPEQIGGHPASEKSDVYAFGVLLYRMLSGALPFEGQTREELFAKHPEARGYLRDPKGYRLYDRREELVEKLLREVKRNEKKAAPNPKRKPVEN